ncbi:MAG: diguanylate cyclase [Candidatus Moraniibacteriota bacterium]
MTNKELEKVSMHDPLTGFYTRSFFEQKMSEFKKDGSVPFGVIACDVDGLKEVNDKFGHSAGDELLKRASRVLSRSFRKSDFIFRVGGDEFVVLIPRCSERIIKGIASRIRKNVELVNREKGGEFDLSLSIGWVVKQEEPLDLGEEEKTAEKNIYKEKLLKIKSARSQSFNMLVEVLKERDYLTAGHIKRVREWCIEMANHLGLPDGQKNDLALFAHFHDVGKVEVPDRILLKEDDFNPEEFEQMKKHCESGYRIAKASDGMESIADFILKHHEWWNGEGYPLGLKGKEIPLECRILHIVDAYDAMTSDRAYQKARSKEYAIKELKRGKGGQFDPYLVDEFLKILNLNKDK